MRSTRAAIRDTVVSYAISDEDGARKKGSRQAAINRSKKGAESGDEIAQGFRTGHANTYVTKMEANMKTTSKKQLATIFMLFVICIAITAHAASPDKARLLLQ